MSGASDDPDRGFGPVICAMLKQGVCVAIIAPSGDQIISDNPKLAAAILQVIAGDAVIMPVGGQIYPERTDQ